MKLLLTLFPVLLPLLGLAQTTNIIILPDNRPKSTYVSQYVPLPLGIIERALQAKNAQYEASVRECHSQMIDLYNAKEGQVAPTITDGKHKVTLTGSGICTEATVIVDKGRVFSIPIQNGGYLTDFTLSTPIEDCYSKISFPNKETGVPITLEVLFLEDLYR